MDHVRGSSLVWPATLDTLRPFVLTWWSGRTVKDMPADLRAVYDAAGFDRPNINIALVVLDEKGEYIRSLIPQVRPAASRFDPESQGRDFKKQLDGMLAGLEFPKIPAPAKLKLTLPEPCGDGKPSGVRIYLTAAENRLNHYRTPIVEAVAMTDAMRKALSLPGTSKTLDASDLKPWLEQIYPAAIMDGHGGFREIAGTLAFKSAGSKGGSRYATIEGTVNFELDNASRSRYRGDVAILLKYSGESGELSTIRGVCECVVPKGPERIKLTAAIESRPE